MVGRKDKFCWKCHKEEKEVLSCELCPRSYHLKCVLLRERPQEAWVCPECVLVTHADDEASRSTNMRMMTLKEQRKILQNVVKMMKDVKLADNFFEHVNTTEFPDYLQFIVKPMCISTLEEMVDNREITSTQGLFAETKWIHHNCVVYNGLNAGLTGVAKALKKICRDECIKIEICPECFLHTCRHGAKGFIRVCKRPHVPVWARMTGFPFWPAKAMGMKDGGVQVFFFADHNRAVVPSSEVFLYSQDIPFPNQRNSRKQRLEDAVEEMKQHLNQLMKKEYTLKLAPCQTPYDPNRDEEHRRMMLPNYVEWVPQKRSRTNMTDTMVSYSKAVQEPAESTHTWGVLRATAYTNMFVHGTYLLGAVLPLLLNPDLTAKWCTLGSE
ncbi:unnamed protein product [Timema podura]|uniref:Protein kinase C-binding protein 1 n=1 Tax=Timema podura TaxID=61482 RepID=A0ABN7NJ92_TIMPD|nr:unnamed protein product [Timema podura]